MKRHLAILGMTSTVFAFPTLALADATKLPETAKQLSREEVIAIYDGKLYLWKHPNGDFGTTTYNAKAATIGGNFNVGKNKGEWEGKVTWKGDQYCFRTRGKGKGKYGPLECNLIFLDGTTAYEVHPKTKKVKSINTPG